MQRIPLSLAVPVACVFACGDATQPAPPPPLLTAPTFASAADIGDGPVGNTRCVEDLNYFVDPGHFHVSYQPATTFSDPDTLVHPNQCGDLRFDNRTRSFTTTYASGDPPMENPWKMWWRRPRSQEFGTAVSVDSINALERDPGVPHTQYVAMPLSNQYDAIGAVLVMYTDYLDVDEWGEAAFTPPYEGPWPDLNLMVQHWRHIDPPVLNSATVNGSTVTLGWSNSRFYLRSIDSTNVYRNALRIATVGPTVTSHPDSNLAPDTYTYTVKHVSLSAAPMNPPYPNSASSNSKTATILPPPPLAVTISGPTYISTPGSYTWTATVTGGTPPYTYQWWYKLLTGGTWKKLTGETGPSYTRYVGYSQWAFRLRADVLDSLGVGASGQIAVDVGWGARPMADPSGK